MLNLDSIHNIWSLACTAAAMVVNTIAIIAMVRADREVVKAIRAMDMLSSSRASRRAEAAVSSLDRSAATHASASSFAGVLPGPNFPNAISVSTQSGPRDSYSLRVSSIISADVVEAGIDEPLTGGQVSKGTKGCNEPGRRCGALFETPKTKKVYLAPLDIQTSVLTYPAPDRPC